ncbi:hypothetical protein F2Q70_00018630 [Brassica cretica]|uniref:Solute carrier family 40 member n=1 Tax=Brassica cretica TaxID=69181 RepID=A0A8S9I0B1_BRACR|nr:hypothetical protein F2Q70_00018630 [Brassica cretica]
MWTQDAELREINLRSKFIPSRKWVFLDRAEAVAEAVEQEYGCKLCIGPCTTKGEGFYYDAFYDGLGLKDDDFPNIEAGAAKATKEAQHFERIEVTKDQALEMFSDNNFKVLSRLGHMSYGVVGAQILQTGIPSSKANLIGATEISVASLAESLMLGVAIAANDASHFGFLAVLSLLSVVAASLIFCRLLRNPTDEQRRLFSFDPLAN